jgi:Protein of unknown function (DUF4229)
MSPALNYTLARAAILGATLAVLWLVGARGILLVLLAVLISGLISYFALSGMRDAVSARVAERVQRISQRIDERTRAEDSDDEGSAR